MSAHTPVSKGNEHTCLDCKVLPPFSVVLCPLHAAAPRTLEALEQAAAALATIANRDEQHFGHRELTLAIRDFAKENFDKARAAIRAARGTDHA